MVTGSHWFPTGSRNQSREWFPLVPNRFRTHPEIASEWYPECVTPLKGGTTGNHTHSTRRTDQDLAHAGNQS